MRNSLRRESVGEKTPDVTARSRRLAVEHGKGSSGKAPPRTAFPGWLGTRRRGGCIDDPADKPVKSNNAVFARSLLRCSCCFCRCSFCCSCKQVSQVLYSSGPSLHHSTQAKPKT